MSKITENHVKFIAEKYPHSVGNNTEFVLCFVEYTLESRNLPKTWENMRAIMKEYPLESITRKRRQYVPSTKGQRAKEEDYRQEYSL